jgi:hypothetical protein
MKFEWNEVDVQCKPNGMRAKGHEWNEMEVNISWMKVKVKDLNELRWMWMQVKWNENERTWMNLSGCECKSNGVRMKGLEWILMDVSASLMEN